MITGRKKSNTPFSRPKTGKHDKPGVEEKIGIAGWKLWIFRCMALLFGPAVFLGLLELSLRLAGFGYPTSFLLPTSEDAKTVFVQNNQFGWRFFGPRMSRSPFPISIQKNKSSDTVRIFVFGESAAKGEPAPRFGLPRMLQTMLSARHPGVRFEVVNAAMTAINSHAVLPIARDCVDMNGDIWVIYMGNNEVVGPFGAGTVFGPHTPPLPLIRASLAVKATRTGQLMDTLFEKTRGSSPEDAEWGGMKMFRQQQVRADDSRMNGVYHHFERNLSEILEVGQRGGVGIVVSTVAVNLKNCAPFASSHRPGLSESDRSRWEHFYTPGVQAWKSGNYEEATKTFRRAAEIDDTFAELRFLQGQCALALGDVPEAQAQLRAARDLDTLRFRCDSRLNEVTRQIATVREGEHILLADAERAFAEQSPEGLPGEESFYEHVHLTFAGNYLLARTIASKVEELLPTWVASHGNAIQPWPAVADCARRLAWTDWNRLAVLNDIRSRLSNPPFTGQVNHEEQVQKLSMVILGLASVSEAERVSEARKASEAAVATTPDDPWLYAQLAVLRELTGDLPGATASAKRELELLPSDAEGWWQLGVSLARQKKYEDAIAAFRRTFELDTRDVRPLANLAQSLIQLDRREEAIQEYRHALNIQPHFSLAWIGLGEAYEQLHRNSEAENCYRKALANHLYASEVPLLARFCQSRGWFEAAATNYARAIELNPLDARLRVEAGQNLITLKRFAEAGEQFSEAVRIEPELAEAHALYGAVLGQQGKPAEGEQQFREALRLEPNLLEARLNLGISLMSQGNDADALDQLEHVLQRNPTNALALKYAHILRAKRESKQSP